LAEFQCVRSRICWIVDLVVPTRREICASHLGIGDFQLAHRVGFGALDFLA
jgi:hypothetical protein